MPLETDIVELKKKVFSEINWINYLENQKIGFGKIDLTSSFNSLFFTFLKLFFYNSEDNIYIEFIKNKTLCSSKKERVHFVKKISKHFLFGTKTDYRFLLIAEIIYSADIFNIDFNDSLKNCILKELGFKEKHFDKIIQQVKTISLFKDKRILESFSCFYDFKNSLTEYNKLRIVNVGVCAAMSAGKSSFVNALLGYDYLPMRNEATTARITSVSDNDNAEKLIGFTIHSNKILSVSRDLNTKTIDEWNSDNEVEHIILQGNLDNIGNDGVIVTVHDTPGTNNSGDTKHHDMTFEFLKNNKMDAIIFVANVEHLCTTDEAELLKELYEKVIELQNIPVIFVLNKADSVDTEKETLESVITHYKDYIKELGFTNSRFFPVSAKAARLLKMAIKNKSDIFSESECDIFPSIVRKFTKRLNLSDVEEIQKADTTEITVDGEIYKKSELITALFHTGINRIEKEIETIIKR